MVVDGSLAMGIPTMVSASNSLLLSLPACRESETDLPHTDGNSLVREATSLEKPFIFVCLNYRLGYFGFLSSRELQAEAARNGEDYQPNLGLYDQRLGLQWVCR